MKQFQLAMELLSPAIFGNGESVNGLVNSDVKFDKNGYPFFSGKTFMGNLLQAVQDILVPYYNAAEEKDKFREVIKVLFGREVTDAGRLVQIPIGSSFQIGDFYLEGQLHNAVEKKIELLNVFKMEKKSLNNIQRMWIQDALTDIRHATRIENGTAKSGSLRTYREVKAGMLFVSRASLTIPSNAKVTETECLQVLDEALMALKHVGMNKFKGKGAAIFRRLAESDANSLKYDPIQRPLCLQCEWELLEPVKIGDSHKSYDYEECKQYLTGASIRGAIIQALLQQKGAEARLPVLLNDLCFSHGYPLYYDKANSGSGNKAFPMTEAFVTTKEMKKVNCPHYKFSTLTLKEDQKLAEFIRIWDDADKKDKFQNKVKSEDFAVYSRLSEGIEIKEIQVNTVFSMHQSKQLDEENLFRYEAIEKGQCFYSTIEVLGESESVRSEGIELLNEIGQLLNKKQQFHLGGSRHAGYGRVLLKSIKALPSIDSDFVSQPLNDDFTYVYFLSDAILSDSYGRIGMWDEELLKYLEMACVTPVQTTGFNATWQSHLPQCTAIKAGSILRLRKMDAEFVQELMNRFFYMRKQEGFGAYCIDPEFLNAQTISKTKLSAAENLKMSYLGLTNLRNDKLKIRESQLSEYMDSALIEEMVTRVVSSLIVDSVPALDETVKNSQWHQILNQMNIALNENKDKPLSAFIESLKRERTEVSENEQRAEKNIRLLRSQLMTYVEMDSVNTAKTSSKYSREAKVSLQNLIKMFANAHDFNEMVKQIAEEVIKRFAKSTSSTLENQAEATKALEDKSINMFIASNGEQLVLKTLKAIIYYDMRGDE